VEISLFDVDEAIRFERIVFYPYPGLDKIWARIWLSMVQDKQPNVEIRVYDPDGIENMSAYLMSQTESRVETTLHLKDPHPGETYHVRAEITVGFGENTEFIEAQEFDMTLEFRDPETPEPGFGMGVDWESIKTTDQTDLSQE